MKKNIKLFSLALATIVFASCNKDEATGDSVLIVNQGVTGVVTTLPPAVTVPVTPPLVFGTTPIVVDEVNENEFNFTLTLSMPQPVPVVVKTVQIAGDATIGVDYEVEDVTIPAYATSATGKIKILNDVTVEGVETATLQISDVSTANAKFAPQTVTFTINNYLSDTLEMSLKFNQNFSISGTAYSLCGIGYDMDFYVLDASMNDTGNYTAAASGCPEKLKMDLATTPDGTYYIVSDIFDDGGISGQYHDPFDIPISADYIRAGGITAGSFIQDTLNGPFITSIDGSGGGLVCVVKVLGGVFTIENSAADVIATGRTASFKNKIKAAISAARANNHK